MERTKFAKINEIARTFTGIAEMAESGTLLWMMNGKLHREDGPAVIYQNGLEFYYLNGLRHRADGPYFINADGSKEWWLHGQKVSAQDVFDQLTPDQLDKVVWEINEWK